MLLHAIAIGGLRMIDGNEADDKIVAVLEGDYVWSAVTDMAELPRILVERLEHYFSTYKLVPGAELQIRVQQVYGVEHARRVIEAAIEDYRALNREAP